MENHQPAKLNKEKAYALLTYGLENPENIKYITHCRYVGNLAGMIAAELGADPELATVLGYLHDIGRKTDNLNHTYEGYCYLKNNGYEEYAFICLTHSFLNNDIDCTAGRRPAKGRNGFEIMKNFVENHKNTVYDEIIQMCDLLCLDSGGTTLENRLADIEERKGRHIKSEYHRHTAIALKEKIEGQMGHSIYDFYPRLNSK